VTRSMQKHEAMPRKGASSARTVSRRGVTTHNTAECAARCNAATQTHARKSPRRTFHGEDGAHDIAHGGPEHGDDGLIVVQSKGLRSRHRLPAHVHLSADIQNGVELELSNPNETADVV
jgi:hypothetical protein